MTFREWAGNNLKGYTYGMDIFYGHIDCSFAHLTSLEGAPRVVRGYFDCNSNNLTSLEGAPREIHEDFYCYNNNITSLEESPEKVYGQMYCHNNHIKSLKGVPYVSKLYSDFTDKEVEEYYEENFIEQMI